MCIDVRAGGIDVRWVLALFGHAILVNAILLNAILVNAWYFHLGSMGPRSMVSESLV